MEKVAVEICRHMEEVEKEIGGGGDLQTYGGGGDRDGGGGDL